MATKSFCRAPSLYAQIRKGVFSEDLSWAAKGALAYLLTADRPEAPAEDSDFEAAFTELKEKGFIAEHGDRLVVREAIAEDAPDSVEAVKVSGSEKRANCPTKQLVELYHQLCPSLPRTVKIAGTNKERFLRARWTEYPNLDFWTEFFSKVESSKFLTGKVSPPPGKRQFLADFEWILRPSNFANILEGRYNREFVRPPVQQVAPQVEAMAAWEELLSYVKKGRFSKPEKFNKPFTENVLTSMGGWGAACNWNVDSISFRRAEFIKIYVSYMDNGSQMAVGMTR